MRLSCVMVTCDMEKSKGNAVFHSIASVFNQDLDSFELIIVDNSNVKVEKNKKQLKLYVNEFILKTGKNVSFKLIYRKKTLNVNKARNLGASLATGDLLVFIEADTIILDNNIFSEVLRISNSFDFGYGAKRLWTKEKWFQHNSQFVLKQIMEGKYDFLKFNTGEYPLSFRKKADGEVFSLLQNYTFIANFGFCKRSIFLKLGGFPIYSFLDLSDDCIIFRLFDGGYKFKFLGDFSVVHVSHKRKRINHPENFSKYFEELRSHGYYWCNISKTFKHKIKLSEILEPLKSVHYDFRVTEMYNKYIQLLPLNIQKKGGDFYFWEKNNLFSIMDFSILLKRLLLTSSVDDFIKESCADFDNLATFLNVVLKNDLISFTSSGEIKNKSFLRDLNIIKQQFYSVLPKGSLNQFPCDSNSVMRRAKFFLDRYPFVEYIRVAILGDDDFLSPILASVPSIFPVVLEKDPRIVSKLKKINKKIDIRTVDFSDDANFLKLDVPKVATFITDPPYTLHGILAFIYRGLSLLQYDDDWKEFYVVINPTMIGKNFYHIIKILSSANVFLYEVRNNFSHYMLPQNFKERVRANRFFRNINLPKNMVKYSSSSNLYIFRTKNPRLIEICKKLDYTKIYNHYL